VTGRPEPVVAIDGPAGAGKSTAARRLAAELGYVLVDTGALYRAVALAAREKGVDWDDGAQLGEVTRSLQLSFQPGEQGRPRVFVEGRDRSDDIRTPVISRGASNVSKHPEVREALLGIQRELGSSGGVVLEGRDIGTVVFPDAEVKVFLTASAEERARRRVDELQQRGTDVGYEDTLSDIRARDAQDSARPVAPLRQADDAVVLDTSQLDADEVVARLVDIVQARAAQQGTPPRDS
jgi:cytidylate kinase